MSFYAIIYTYGVASNSDGLRCGSYVAFPTRAQRDRFVAAGQPYRTQTGFREAVSSRNPELRRVRGWEASSKQWGELADEPEEQGMMVPAP